jgi:hypothetical protein
VTISDDVGQAEVVELLQQLIRNECVNDDRVESGQEIRSADVLQSYFEGSGIDLETFDAAPVDVASSRASRAPTRAHRPCCSWDTPTSSR